LLPLGGIIIGFHHYISKYLTSSLMYSARTRIPDQATLVSQIINRLSLPDYCSVLLSAELPYAAYDVLRTGPHAAKLRVYTTTTSMCVQVKVEDGVFTLRLMDPTVDRWAFHSMARGVADRLPDLLVPLGVPSPRIQEVPGALPPSAVLGLMKQEAEEMLRVASGEVHPPLPPLYVVHEDMRVFLATASVGEVNGAAAGRVVDVLVSAVYCASTRCASDAPALRSAAEALLRICSESLQVCDRVIQAQRLPDALVAVAQRHSMFSERVPLLLMELLAKVHAPFSGIVGQRVSTACDVLHRSVYARVRRAAADLIMMTV